MSNSLNNVAIVLNSYFGPFMTEFARLLHEQYNSRVHLYCKSDAEVEHYLNSESAALFDSVTNFMLFFPALRDEALDKDKELNIARDYESRMGTTYSKLSVSNRHVGKGYALGGFNHPRSFYSGADYLHMVHAYNVQLLFWENELINKKTDLVIADNKELAVISRMLNVPFRTMARARYKNLHYWELNEYREAKLVQDEFNEIRKDENEASSVTEHEKLPPYNAGKEIIKRNMQYSSFTKILKRIGYLCLRYTYWRIRKDEKARGYFLKDQVCSVFRQRRDILRMSSNETVTLEELERTPFIFYPLHTEPEQSLGQISPEYFYQLEAIAAISSNLPAGVKLVVKEVPMACGRRTDSFYEQILLHKNVDMLNLAIPGPEVIKRALGVITIAGTAGLEAALLGKPVISFGRHNPYNFLEHVMVVKDLADLPDMIMCMIKKEINHGQARVDANLYIQALKKVCFDMGKFDYHDLNSFSSKAPEEALKQLCRSLGIKTNVNKVAFD